jgi:chromosome segregation ATPase
MATDPLDDGIPTIIVDKDDRESFHRTRMQSGNKPSPAELADSGNTKSAGGNGFWISLVLIVAMAACGASYWLYQQHLLQQTAVKNAEQRIEELERRLSATGEEMGESAVAMQVKVTELSAKTQELWEQMDKLWASAWRKNQSDIKDLSDDMSKNNSALSDQNKQLKTLAADININSTNFGLLQEQLDSQVASTQDLAGTLAKTKLSGDNFEQQLAQLQVRLTSLTQANNKLANQLSELEKWRITAEKATQTPPQIF